MKKYIITYSDSTDETWGIDCYLECTEDELALELRRFSKDDWGVEVHEVAKTTQLPEFLVPPKQSEKVSDRPEISEVDTFLGVTPHAEKHIY